MSLFQDLRVFSRQQDGHLRLLPKTDYGFARGAAELDAHVVELQWLVPVLPMAFRLDGDGARLVAVTGLEAGRNLFVGADGTWRAATKPAVLETYPFTITRDRRDSDVLAVDRASDLLSGDDGEPLMTADGDASSVLQAYNDDLQRQLKNRYVMASGIQRLQAAGVLEPLALEGSDFIDGSRHYFAELKVLRTMAQAELGELCQDFALEMAYAQAYSLFNLRSLRRLAEAESAAAAKPASGVGLAGDDDDAPLDFSLLD